MLKEFREFVMRGNVVDLAVGIIIGGAFGKIISSLVNDILMPLIGLLLGGIDFSGQSFQIGEAVVSWGAFLQSILDFVIVAVIIFLMIKAINKLQRPAPAPEETTRECPHCLSKIAVKATRCPYCTSNLE